LAPRPEIGVAVGLIVLIDALQHQPTEEGFTVSFNNRVAQQYHHFMRRVRHFKSEPNRMAHLKGKAMSLLRKASRLRPGVFYKLRSKTQFDLPANVRYVVAANSQANLPVGTQNVESTANYVGSRAATNPGQLTLLRAIRCSHTRNLMIRLITN
jgi:hypothetical protein